MVSDHGDLETVVTEWFILQSLLSRDLTTGCELHEAEILAAAGEN